MVHTAAFGLTPLEESWLEYARKIAACDPEHLAECRRLGGGIDPGPDLSLRWPGFVGRDYESAPKRVLCVAQVHNPNGWDNPISGLSTMEPLLRDWIERGLGDAAFLSAYRDVYAERMVTWGPWIKAFGRVLEDQRIELVPQQVAYVNFAKCWLNTDKAVQPGEKRVTQYPLMRACEKYFSIAALSSILQPDAIIVLSGQTVLPVCGISMPHDVPWKSFSGRSFQVTGEDIEDMIAWLAAVQPRARAHGVDQTALKNEAADDLEAPTLEIEPEPPFVAEPTGAETKELIVYKPSWLRGQEPIPGTVLGDNYPDRSASTILAAPERVAV